MGGGTEGWAGRGGLCGRGRRAKMAAGSRAEGVVRGGRGIFPVRSSGVTAVGLLGSLRAEGNPCGGVNK